MIVLKPERSKRKSKRWRKVKRKLPFIVGVGVFVVIFYFALFSPLFKITNVVIEGNKNIPGDKLQDELSVKLQGDILFLLPADNLFLASQTGLEKYLMDRFKRIETVQVSKKFLNTLHVSLTEKRGAFKWCRLSGCFLINENGVAYNIPLDESALIEEERNLLTINESINSVPSQGEVVADNGFIKAVWNINDQLGPEIAEFQTPSVLSERLVVVMKEGWRVLFKSDSSIESQFANFKALFPDEITLEERKNLEYIDLTVEGRAYYKIKH